MSTLLLDLTDWDLVLDASDNIAVAGDPYALAQDASSAIRTFSGEVYWDRSLGVPYLTQILGHRPPLSLVKAQMESQAEAVPGVASSKCFLSTFTDRGLSGQVQVIPETSAPGAQPAFADFTVLDPQVY